jgi:predicted dehydrogenase
MNNQKNKMGVALVGLGEYSTDQLAPALKESTRCYLAGIVSGSPKKQERWKLKFNLNDNAIYDYKTFDTITSNPDINIVYIVLPNALHAEYAIRAARAGKHIIIEKPMATTPEDCRRIIKACKEAGVLLSVGYRLHFDPFNQEMMRLGQQHHFGNVHRVIADDSMEIGDKNQWRLNYELSGGGPLVNNGIYCVQAAIYITGRIPVRVTAKFDAVTDPEKFNSVEEGISWEMEFEDGATAICKTNYSRNGNLLRAEAEHGWFELDPAYEYTGLKGRTSTGKMNLKNVCQQAQQLDDFALSIKKNEEPKLSGEMGLRDVEILMAIYQSAKTGNPVDLRLNHLEASLRNN